MTTEAPVGNLFILIVEREVGEMEAVYTTLLRQAYDYGFARTREDAIRIMCTKLYDYVIMDYTMPGMSVADFQSVLRDTESKTKIIFTYPKSSASPEIALKDCQWLGVPFQAPDLLKLLS
jgi:DNA-binding response OmpR family regulator